MKKFKFELARLHLSMIILIIIFLASFFFLRPAIWEIYNLRKQISAERGTLLNLTQKISYLQSLDKSELTPKVEQVLMVLPEEKDAPTILAELRVLCTQTGLGLKSFDVSPGVISSPSAGVKDVLSFFEVELVIEGERNKLRDFFDKIVTLAPLTDVKKVSISGLEAKISFRTYFLNYPKALVPVSQSISLITPDEENIYEKLKKINPTEGQITTPENIPGGKSNPFSP